MFLNLLLSKILGDMPAGTWNLKENSLTSSSSTLCLTGTLYIDWDKLEPLGQMPHNDQTQVHIFWYYCPRFDNLQKCNLGRYPRYCNRSSHRDNSDKHSHSRQLVAFDTYFRKYYEYSSTNRPRTPCKRSHSNTSCR